MTALSLILPGAVLALGLVLVVASFRPQHARLGDALAVLTDRAPAITPVEDASGAQGVERLGEWWVRSRQVVARIFSSSRLRTTISGGGARNSVPILSASSSRVQPGPCVAISRIVPSGSVK